MKLPYGRSDLAAFLHENGRVLSERYGEDAIRMEAEIDKTLLHRFLPFSDE